jgi:catechol 2,3-dioxygenase-like lactoylglutathione lyase family enzyme
MITGMDWRLEVVVVPVSDVDRAKEFYGEKLGFPVDTDHRAGESFRVVQVTPPGSACSIVFGHGMGEGEPGSLKGLQLVVDDVAEAHAHLEAQGIGTSGLQHFVDGVMTPGPDPEGREYGTFVFFSDLDGNSWAVQQGKRPARP